MKEDLLAVQSRQRKGLMVLAFVGVALMFLAWRFEVAQDEFRAYLHESCLTRQTNAQRLNDQAESLASLDEEFLATGDDLAPAVREVISSRIEAYRGGILTIPTCD
jgi:hypothetical protein